MRLLSPTPEVVGEISPDLFDGIPVNTFLDATYRVATSEADPEFWSESTLPDSRVWNRLLRLIGIDQPSASTTDLQTENLMEVIHALDTDYRAQESVPVDEATLHLISLRSGSGNVTNIVQEYKRKVMPFGFPTYLFQGHPHTDLNPTYETRARQYTAVLGDQTRYFDGDFYLPERFAKYNFAMTGLQYTYLGMVLGLQIRKKLPIIFQEGQLVRAHLQTIHQMPECIQSLEFPRKFFRDRVTIEEIH